MSVATKAVILARVSSRAQEDEGYSLDSQVKLLGAYCQNKELIAVKTFKVTESASKTSQRKIFREAMKFIEDNDIKHLVIEKVDRHVRNLHDAVETHDWLLADEEKQVHFVKDSLILHKNSRSQEWLNWGIRVVMAKNYIDNLREEAMKGWAEKLAQGWLPAPPPPGYVTITQDGKRIHVPEPENSKLMVKVFRFYVSPEGSIKAAGEYMTSLGVTTRTGRPFAKSNVHLTLMNPFYIGINRMNGKEYPGAQETFIPKRLFQQVQEKLHGGKPQKFKTHTNPLKSIVYCIDCNSVVTWQKQKGRYYGVCRRLPDECKKGSMLREDKIEEMIVKRLEELVSPSPEIIDWVVSSIQDRNNDKIKERELLESTLTAKLKRLGTMDEMLYDDKLAGDITKERYEDKHEHIIAQRAALQDELASIDTSIGDRLKQRQVVLELSQKAAEIYPNRTPAQKRIIISKLFDKLTLEGGILSVKHSKFAEAIAQNVQKSIKIMETEK